MNLFIKLYGFLGFFLILTAEVLLFTDSEFISMWMTPVAWTGYIFFLDSIIYSKKGSSLITRSPFNFLLMCLLSIGTWYIFEFYNIFLKNWYYINLPGNKIIRYTGYFWSFATIFPAIFETIEALTLFTGKKFNNKHEQFYSISSTMYIIIGVIFLAVPLIIHSRYLFPPVWLGFIFLLDPLNLKLNGNSILNRLKNKRWKLTIIILFSGLICGFLWEFWNYWAETKWIYDVPYLSSIKIFEMPVLGYLGFPVFALECYIMYIFEINSESVNRSTS
ncbi:hypothetical protein ACFL4T_11740, partial [candidate division KSB1 bacterium]